MLRLATLFGTVAAALRCYTAHAEWTDGGEDRTPGPDDARDADVDADADVPPDGSCILPPDTLVSGGYAVTRLEVVRPNIFGSVSPTLTNRIAAEDIYVLLATNLMMTDGRFILEVGPGWETSYPAPVSRFCSDALCGWPPNNVTTFSAVATCNHVRTETTANLTFSLYPPSHGGAATLLTIQNAALEFDFDTNRRNITGGTLTGRILESEAPLVFPAYGVTLADLFRGASVPPDVDVNGDGVMDAWNVELSFVAGAVPLERPLSP